MASRLTAAVVLVALLNACASPRVVRLDTGQGTPLEYRPASNKSLKVGAEAFEEALTQLALEIPLTLRPPPQGWLMRASYPSDGPDTRWQSLMSKSFGGLCQPGQRRDTCLSLLDDVMGLSERDKLERATDSATTWDELESASQRWADRVGPEVARVFVLAVTVVVSHGMAGGSAALASRLSVLPHFPQAAAAGASRFGINLANVGQVSTVAVVGGTIVISLPATAVAMAAQGMSVATPPANPAPLRPEQGYLGSKKHGLKWTEGAATAKSTQTPQGQWGSVSDLEFAGRKAAGLKPGEGAYFDLPEGHSSFVWRVDGTRVPAKRLWVRNNGTGTFHGYPLE